MLTFIIFPLVAFQLTFNLFEKLELKYQKISLRSPIIFIPLFREKKTEDTFCFYVDFTEMVSDTILKTLKVLVSLVSNEPIEKRNIVFDNIIKNLAYYQTNDTLVSTCLVYALFIDLKEGV